MPIYEYRCQDCGQKSSVFFRTFSSVAPVRCPHCGSQAMDRMVSRVSVLKPWGESLNWIPSAESLEDVDEDDPVAMEGWLRRMRQEMGTDLGDDLADTMTKMDAGIAPPWFDDEGGDLGDDEE